MLTAYLVQYAYVPDIQEQREPHRAAHLARIVEAEEAGTLRLAGVFTDPLDGAVLVLHASDAAQVHQWVRDDPYHAAGLITGFTVRQLALAVPSEGAPARP